MGKRETAFTATARFAAALLFTAALASGCASGMVKRPAPAFEATRFSGGKVRLGDFKGKPLVINFWASWCPPCRAEMPSLVKAWKQYRKKGVEFLAIATGDTRADAEDFLRANKITLPAAYDDEEGSIFANYRGNYLPTTFFINRRGIIVDRQVGYMNHKTLIKKLNRLLASK